MDPTLVPSWAQLPEPALLSVFSFLALPCRLRAAATCRLWLCAVEHPMFWRHLDIKLNGSESHDIAQINLVRRFGHYLSVLYLTVNQEMPSARNCAQQLLTCLSSNQGASESFEQDKVNSSAATQMTRRPQLLELYVAFTGVNPLFYAGVDIVNSLTDLVRHQHNLRVFDLERLPVSVDSLLVQALAENCQQLRKVNLLNEQLIVKVSPSIVAQLVRRNPYLKQLHLSHASFAEEVLSELMASNRRALSHLSLKVSLEVKYRSAVSEKWWQEARALLPDLRVTMIFDERVRLHCITEVLVPSLPLERLKLFTYAQVHEQLNHVAAYHSSTLRHLEAYTSERSVDLEMALINLVGCCTLLRYLVVDAAISERSISEIVRLRPELNAPGGFVRLCVDSTKIPPMPIRELRDYRHNAHFANDN